MAQSIRIRASANGDETTVKALITHPMETGMRKDKKTGEKIPAHFIQEVTVEHNGAAVMTARIRVASPTRLPTPMRPNAIDNAGDHQTATAAPMANVMARSGFPIGPGNRR